MNTDTHASEVANGERFEFGKNWSRFLQGLTEEKIGEAEASLKKMLRVESLSGKSFLDIGSGSGLFSLAARRLGAKVTSFDFDPNSVACTQGVKKQFFPDDDEWTVLQGSVLDAEFMSNLGTFDIVYSWGVLHHTGNMETAIDLASATVADKGSFFIALYNDQGWISKYWTVIKKVYNSGALGRVLALAVSAPYFCLHVLLKLALSKSIPRGMSFWTDVVDWVGGYPFEVATPEAVVDEFYQKGFLLAKQKTVRNKLGCNEFVFRKI
jgi:SAM-dependent methyltransferase